MIDFLRWKTEISSIKIKSTMIVMLISIVSFGVAAFFSTQWLAEEIEDDYNEKAHLMSVHIIHDLENAMLREDHEEILRTLDFYKRYKDVEQVRVFNPKGQEVFGQGQGPAGVRVEEVLRTGEPTHFYEEIDRRKWATFITPLKNDPQCHRCHGNNETLRGALLLSLNQEGMARYIGLQKQRFFILFGLLALTIIAATLLAVTRLFLRPLKEIQKGAEAIGKGQFEYRIAVASRDEIGNLAKNFNQMAQTLQNKNDTLWEQLRLLSVSYKEWQETFDIITDLISVIDRDCNIIKANRAFHRYFSISPFAQINKKCHELFGACLQSACPCSTASQERTPVSREVQDPHSGRMLQVSLFPCFSSEGGLISSVLIAKDITEKKENEMRLIMNERLAALGQMASGIAHEINNPLATISACVEGLLKRMGEGRFDFPLFERYLKIMEEEINRCKGITTTMLSFVRKTTHDRKEVNIHEALDKTLEIISLQGRMKEVEVLRHFAEGMPTIRINEGELRQVLLVIVLNALDAIRNKGNLTLETGRNGNRVFIRISDTGPGIPLATIGKIFDPFFTTKLETGGTGLGLSIANKIISENKGKIEVTSEEGKGTAFTIILPSG